jgi:hypothetical protein
VLQEHVGEDEVGVDDAADAHPASGDLLGAEGIGQQRLAQAAVLLRDHQPEDAHLLHALDDCRGVLVLVLELRGDGQDLLLDELPDQREQVGLVLGETVGLLQSCHWVAASRLGNGLPASMPSAHLPGAAPVV